MKSLTYNILQAQTEDKVELGNIITVDVDRIMAHDGSGPVVVNTLKKHRIDKMLGIKQLVFVFDHYYPPKTEREAKLQKVVREFSSKFNVPLLQGVGIAHQILPEKGLLNPGTVFVGGDSHTCTGGAFGIYATGLGATDVAGVLASGKLWIQVPELMRIRLENKLSENVNGNDVVLHILREIGFNGALGKSVEFSGPGIAELSIEDRMKISNSGVEMGAVASIFPVDDTAQNWLKNKGCNLESASIAAPFEQAEYDLLVDLSQVEKLIAFPSKPDNVYKVKEVDLIKVDQVFIGSCSGGFLEDLTIAAQLLEGRKVAEGVRLLIGPSSQEVYMQAVKEGIIEKLITAGADILPPGCGACLGNIGALGDGEVSIATQNRNFVGRAGSAESSIYLASSYVAAKAAVEGTVRSELLC